MSELSESYSYSFSLAYRFIFLICLINLKQNAALIDTKLNKINLLSNENCIYNHISITSKGDLIIDLSSSLENKKKERIFYGLNSKGSLYFGKETYKILLSTEKREEGECFIIKYRNGTKEDECLIFIPTSTGSYIEYYFLDTEKIQTFKTSDDNNFNEIKSSRFSLVKSPLNKENNNLEYIFSYVRDEKLTVSKGYFDMSKNPYYIKEEIVKIEKAKNMMVSCYFTEKGIYICFYFDTSEKKKKKYVTIVFKTFKDNEKYDITTEFNKDKNDDDDEDDNFKNKFIKAIHLKGEIGAFIYFCYLGNSRRQNYPTILFQQYKDSKLNKYKNLECFLDKYKFSNDEKFNDFIKLNDNQVCYISTDASTIQYLFIVIITLFDSDTKISERYYKQNMANYDIKFYNQIISNLYNNFITILFTYSNLSNKSNEAIYTSLIILGYPDNDDYIINIIEEIKAKNKPVDQLCFSLDKTLNITNNIYGYIFIGTKITNFPDNIDIYLDEEKITKNKIINKDKCVTISFPKNDGIYKAGIYNIELAYIVTEPEYDSIKDYAEINFENYRKNNYGENNERLDYIRHNFTGKYSNYSFIIKNDFLCKDGNCITCDNSPTCLICNKGFDINQYGNKCKFQTTQETEKPTNIVTELKTELDTEEKKVLVSQTIYIPQIISTEINTILSKKKILLKQYPLYLIILLKKIKIIAQMMIYY